MLFLRTFTPLGKKEIRNKKVQKRKKKTLGKPVQLGKKEDSSSPRHFGQPRRPGEKTRKEGVSAGLQGTAGRKVKKGKEKGTRKKKRSTTKRGGKEIDSSFDRSLDWLPILARDKWARAKTGRKLKREKEPGKSRTRGGGEEKNYYSDLPE